MGEYNVQVNDILSKSLEVKKAFAADDRNVDLIGEIAEAILDCVGNSGKVMVFGNGGSAADSQHMAAEFVVRFERKRRAIPCIALTTDTSIMTAVSNDIGYKVCFRRQLEAIARPGDFAIAISTSGRSENVIEAALAAKELGLKVAGILGRDGGDLAGLVDIPLIVREDNTARIQEIHITIIHAICKIVEDHIQG